MADQTLVDLHTVLQTALDSAVARVTELETQLVAAQAELAAKPPAVSDAVRQTVDSLIAQDAALQAGQPGAQIEKRATLLSAGIRRLRDLLAS
jgi:hypothetical protein